jgi:cyclophilin family peptidyl-prolyl cis-trans isomerase
LLRNTAALPERIVIALRLIALTSLLMLPSVMSAAEPDLKAWENALARKTAILVKLPELQKAFRTATEAADREKIAKEFGELRDEFTTKVYPQLAKLASEVYAADPKNFEAGETALEAAFQVNKYDVAAKIGDQLIADGRKTQIVMNVTGVAHFAQHDFAKAKLVLQAAERENVLHPQLGGRYLEETDGYAQYWATEQAIREKEATAAPEKQLPQVLFKTTKGDILLELFENEAPNTVANFISLVEAKEYDKVKFHRVIPNFMAQGGDPLSKDEDLRNDGTGGPGYVIKCECYQPNARMHFRGSLSMAHAGKDSGGSQFFLTHLPTAHLNPNKEEQRGHTVFGRIVKGLDIAAALEVGDVIETAKVVRKRNHKYEPVTQAERN